MGAIAVSEGFRESWVGAIAERCGLTSRWCRRIKVIAKIPTFLNVAQLGRYLATLTGVALVFAVGLL
jgi:hypothetical protein